MFEKKTKKIPRIRLRLNPDDPRLGGIKVRPMTNKSPDSKPDKANKWHIPPGVMARARMRAEHLGQDAKTQAGNPFQLPKFPDQTIPPKGSGMAMDDVFGDPNSSFAWAGSAWALSGISAAYAEGLVFPGYVYLAEISQRAEYRVVADTIAEECTRKWIKFKTKGEDDVDRTERIKQLEDYIEKIQLRNAISKLVRLDYLFGRGHLYIDIGDPALDLNSTSNDPDELVTPIGNGRDDISKSKIGIGWLRRVTAIEPIWCYPTNYNSSDPLNTSWYEPEMWYVMGKRIHQSRLLKFIGREISDILKPAYAFGGMSMSQMLKPYVDNWLRTRQSVADLISAFSVFILSTDLSEVLAVDGEQLFQRIDLFNMLRNNKGLMVINKDTEEFRNVAAPLGTLDSLQAQTQEHMAAVARIPLVKLLGIQPAGLNASSEGEIRVFYDHIHAYQEGFLRVNLTKVIYMVMLSIWGEVDTEIVFEFERLWELDEVSHGNKRRVLAETDILYVQNGIVSPEEVRRKLTNDPDSPYQDLDPADLPEPSIEEGLEDGSGLAGLGASGGESGGEGGNGEGQEVQQGEGSELVGGLPEGGDGEAEEGAGETERGADAEDVEDPAIKQSERNKLTAAAALVRHERRGSYSEDETNEIIKKWEEQKNSSTTGDPSKEENPLG